MSGGLKRRKYCDLAYESVNMHSSFQVKIVPMSNQHFERIASIHVQVLPRDIFALLGARHLKKNVYPQVMTRNVGSVVALVEERVVGFVFVVSGSIWTPTFWLASFGVLTKACLKHPTLLIDMLVVVFSKPRHLPTNEALWVCVKQGLQGRGIGKMMLDTVCASLGQQRSPGGVFVRTLSSTPENVRFYEKCGFLKRRTFAGRVWLSKSY